MTNFIGLIQEIRKHIWHHRVLWYICWGIYKLHKKINSMIRQLTSLGLRIWRKPNYIKQKRMKFDRHRWFTWHKRWRYNKIRRPPIRALFYRFLKRIENQWRYIQNWERGSWDQMISPPKRIVPMKQKCRWLRGNKRKNRCHLFFTIEDNNPDFTIGVFEIVTWWRTGGVNYTRL